MNSLAVIMSTSIPGRSLRTTSRRSPPRLLCALALLTLLSGGGCGDNDEPVAALPTPPPPVDRPTQWIESDLGPLVGVDLDDLRRDLTEATAEAQRTIDDARRRFLASPKANRDRWAVKWAAPIRRGPAAGEREQVWILPIHWTEHRIEGVLANESVHGIGHALGDIVGVPIDEITDWVHTPDAPITGDFAGVREGGFTIAVLERYAGPTPR